MTLLEDEEWSQWSDREIARQCAVSDRFVNKMRAESVTANGSQSEPPPPRTYTTKHGTTATMNTSNIGKRRDDAERAEQVALWIQLTEEKQEAERQAMARADARNIERESDYRMDADEVSRQVGAKPQGGRVQSSQVGKNESKREDGKGHRKEGGVEAARKELGVSRGTAHRAVKIASIPAEVLAALAISERVLCLGCSVLSFCDKTVSPSGLFCFSVSARLAAPTFAKSSLLASCSSMRHATESRRGRFGGLGSC